MSVTFNAVLLAAGRSTRMGRDKALLEAKGVPLWARQRDVLRAAGAREIYLSARPDQAWAAGAVGFAAVVRDALAEAGPLGGITAALERSALAHVAVLAVDLPALSPRWFAELAGDCAAGIGAVGRRGDFFEPLAAIYPTEMKRLAWDAITLEDFSLQRWVAAGVAQGALRVREIPDETAPQFVNWNRADDFRPEER